MLGSAPAEESPLEEEDEGIEELFVPQCLPRLCDLGTVLSEADSGGLCVVLKGTLATSNRADSKTYILICP